RAGAPERDRPAPRLGGHPGAGEDAVPRRVAAAVDGRRFGWRHPRYRGDRRLRPIPAMAGGRAAVGDGRCSGRDGARRRSRRTVPGSAGRPAVADRSTRDLLSVLANSLAQDAVSRTCIEVTTRLCIELTTRLCMEVTTRRGSPSRVVSLIRVLVRV